MMSSSETSGSPPRVRGTVEWPARHHYTIGITPACAGNSYLYPLKADKMRDHPRVCGEQAENSNPERVARGSPPRVRGTEKWLFLPDQMEK